METIDFEHVNAIVSTEKFLNMEGLGNEVPFFIQTYDIKHQDAVYKGIELLKKRLDAEGIPVLAVGLFDLAMGYLEEKGLLRKLFQIEQKTEKEKLKNELGKKLLHPEKVFVPEILKRKKEEEPKLLFLYQVGEIFPFLRTHNLLNHMQKDFSDIPLVLFFPGEYVTSYKEGFYLSLFGNNQFKGDYYRAFKLEDYRIRGGLN